METQSGDWGIENYVSGASTEDISSKVRPTENTDNTTRGGLADVKLLYSTMAPHFSLPQFLETFILNLTLPLPYPYFFWKYGWGFLFSMQFIPFRKYGVLSYVAQIMFYITIVSAALATEAYYWRLPSVLFLVVLHRCMIGLKYSSLSHEEYRLFVGIPEGADDDKYNYPAPEEQQTLEMFQQQLQLTSGWMRISEERLDYELTTAGESCNINMHSCFFKVPGPELGFMHDLQYKRWLHFLQVENLGNKGKDGFYRVSAYQVCNSIFRLAEHSCVSSRSATWAIPILSILNTAIGVFFSNQDFSTISSMGIVFNISSSLVSIFYFSVLEVIMFIAFLDFLRRYNYAVLLSRLARVIDAETRIRISVSKKPKRSARNLNISTRVLNGVSCGNIEIRDDSGRNLSEYTLAPSCSSGLATEEIVLKSLEDEEHNVDPDDTIMPKVDMLIPSNYIVWLNCKQVFLRFGKRTEFRLLVYIGVLFILALLLLFILSFQMGITKDPVGLINSSYFVQSVVYILILGVQQSIIIFVGGMANTKNLQHKNLMTAHVIHLHSKTDNAGPACLAQLQDCMAKAEAVKDSCEAISEAKPLKVLGVECTKERAVGLVSSVVLYILAIVQYAITEGAQNE